MRTTLVAFFLVLAGCGSSSTCQLLTPGQAGACTAGAVIDPDAARCTDSTGSAFICRNGSGYCYVCKGADFTDGCALTGVGTAYCVHECSHC